MTIAEKKILTRLKESGFEYEIFEHEPVYTCEQAARVRGVSPREGIKCLLLKADKSFVLTLTRGDKRIDSKKIAKLENVKKLTLANEKEVEKIAECKIGCVHPFCNVDTVYFDKILLEQEMIEFNPGVHDKTVRIRVKDLLSLLKNPRVMEIGV
jgi:Ala-tRNA(Pro) deacylase